MRHHLTIAALGAMLGLAGCAQLGDLWPLGGRDDGNGVTTAPPPTADAEPGADTTRPESRPGGDGDAATGTNLRSLGTSVATLGDPTRPGQWVETPLARADTRGRVVATGSGAAVDVAVIAAPGAGGSRLSLAAMRAVGADPTALVEIEILVP
ncbi:hypothetical protein [Sediminimonas sp.]|uniref:hypothetical protein n=1 Tax=Sediminimonas sp. TaxID=2823379 RepID=UPI0025DC28F8|nr:hypothetical protein [Sediminimonas sp.]